MIAWVIPMRAGRLGSRRATLFADRQPLLNETRQAIVRFGELPTGRRDRYVPGLRLWLGWILAVVACGHEPDQMHGGDVDAAVAADAAADSPAAADPTACVEWFAWPEQQPTLGMPSWGTQLTDIARHIPAQYGDTYWFDEPITAAHETTHGIQAHLRNYEAPPGKVNAFYVLGNKAAFVVEPAMRKSDIKPHITASLRGPRYDLYLEHQTEWDDTPLYVFDEWNAYVNGAEVGVGQVQAGLYTGQWTDAVMGPLEFTAYALATAAAAKQKDPTYYAKRAA
jgi:hypothetical protein